MTYLRRSINRQNALSEIVNPREFMTFWGLEAHDATRVVPATSETINQNIAAEMGISEETAKELEDVCGKHSLFTGNEPQKKENLYRMNEQPKGPKLHSLEHQINFNKRRETNDALHKSIHHYMRYKVKDVNTLINPKGTVPGTVEPEYKVQMPNVILTVEVKKCRPIGFQNSGPKDTEIFQVLGSQSLTALRDKIQCSSDRMIPGDFSHMPDTDPKTLRTTGDMFKSGFFFIENVFYNDTRLADNRDYSKPIIEWAKQYRPTEEYSTGTMQDMLFFDLNINLGKHYLYRHQGDCEHSFTFTDLRLFNSLDNQDVKAYPILMYTRESVRTICQSCSTISARWSVRNSKLIPGEPTHLCAVCLKSLLYTKDGQKISDFTAHHFVS